MQHSDGDVDYHRLWEMLRQKTREAAAGDGGDGEKSVLGGVGGSSSWGENDIEHMYSTASIA